MLLVIDKESTIEDSSLRKAFALTKKGLDVYKYKKDWESKRTRPKKSEETELIAYQYLVSNPDGSMTVKEYTGEAPAGTKRKMRKRSWLWGAVTIAFVIIAIIAAVLIGG